ncbi:MAG: VOC family protein [Alphaproteobacteria bacterium]
MHSTNSLNLSAYSKGLGEIALATSNIEQLRDFYKNQIGLELIKDFFDEGGNLRISFFKLAGGHEGHTQVLALFHPRAAEKVSISKTSLHHFAINISATDYLHLKEKLQKLMLLKDEAYHEWVNWSSLYINDPDGNTLELVCSGDMAKILSG